MSVTVILDTSTVLSYTEGSVAVGELLSIITDDADTALIPGTCLAEATRRLSNGKDALVSLLSALPCVEIGPLGADQASDVGIAARRSSESCGIDMGHAAIEALTRDAQLATQDVAMMSQLLPTGWPIIEV